MKGCLGIPFKLAFNSGLIWRNPNEPARAMIRKAGYEGVLRVWDSSSLRDKSGLGIAISNADPSAGSSSALELYEAAMAMKNVEKMFLTSLRSGTPWELS
jgi:hypothetical protein